MSRRRKKTQAEAHTYVGIHNVHEFYSEHYLAAVLVDDIKAVVAEWKGDAEEAREAGEEASPPPQRLRRLERPFFRYREQLRGLRSPEDRVEAHERHAAELLDALGYEVRPTRRAAGDRLLPLLAALTRSDGSPLLWILPATSPPAGPDDDGDRDPLGLPLLPEQDSVVRGQTLDEPSAPLGEATVEELATLAFGLEEPPRFILVVSDTQLILLDRTKWAEQRLLRFDLEEILGRRETPTLDATCALLHRSCLAPEEGTPLVDSLDDSSHKHAFAVGKDLKYALRWSIEAIGNEAIRYRTEVSKKKVFGDEIDATQLSIECLRFMYRLLFLLYVEARPELGYAPMGSDAYRQGYSLERLRELEITELLTDDSRDRFHIHDSLRQLFRMVWEGTERTAAQRQTTLAAADGGALAGVLDGEGAASHHHTFHLVPLRAHLFDPERTPFLDKVRLRDGVLLEVIRRMSLSRPKGTGKKKRVGRISYATLGINQLGEVYEALLSFRGFFAEEDLYEVTKKGDADPDPLDVAYFVPERDLHRYETEERVYERDEDGTKRDLKRYPRGTFIYRQSGRDRQKSASYYTPEVLTRCLVKYALKELLEDEDGKDRFTADELLELTICEPAMGSAAFLNEAINQLAERYLVRKQQETGRRIRHEDYAHELQKVRMVLADNNVFGVDLNPIALELAEVSLWLNAIFTYERDARRHVFVPWFGGQLACGNSLVGAWRKVFGRPDVEPGPRGKSAGWLDAVPERIPLGTERPKGSVYHFLLPDKGMAVYGQGNEGKPIREMCADELEVINFWRGEVCKALDEDDLDALRQLSEAVDRLWDKHAEQLKRIRERTTDALDVWGHEHPLRGQAPSTTRDKDRIWEGELLSREVRAASPYRRLKLAMDYWCALWFWPIEKAELLPDRDEWIADLEAILDTHVVPSAKPDPQQRELFPSTKPVDESRQDMAEVGFVDVEKVVAGRERLQVVRELAQRYRFHHWELEFADVFAGRGGFDLVLGNPPWIRVIWREAHVLGDRDPSFVLHRLSATEAGLRRADAVSQPESFSAYRGAHEESSGVQAFLASESNYSLLRGIKANLYKAFLPVAWELTTTSGASGLLHPDGVFDDPRAGRLRRQLYRRLRRHYSFRNEFTLFEGTNDHGRLVFSVNVYGPTRMEPRFHHLSTLLHPKTIDECHAHTGSGVAPGIKDDDNRWETRGHKSRLITVGRSELQLFAPLFDEPDTPPMEARLPALHAQTLVDVLRAFVETPFRLANLPDNRYVATFHFNETYAQKDGTIRREVCFPESAEDWVLSGPHFYVGNPLYKCPRRTVTNASCFDVVDLMEQPDEYVPRSIYRPATSRSEYRRRSPSVPWSVAGSQGSTLDCYRVVANRGLSPTMERTLQVAVLPPGPAHINGVYTFSLDDERLLLLTAATWMSLPIDFFIKSTGAGDFFPNLARKLPVVTHPPFDEPLVARTCALVCLTQDYSALWGHHSTRTWRIEPGPLLRESDPLALSEGGAQWSGAAATRAPAARRAALVEVDVLVSMALGLNLRQLQTIYRVQFPVLRSYEADTWYDTNGRIIFTNSKGLIGVGLNRSKKKGDPNPCWNDVKDMTSGTVQQTIIDDTLPGGPREKTIVYEAPWVRCDRERDYEEVWAHFADRFGIES